LCRYITRPAISEKSLSLTNQGKVRYELKTPYWDGTTHVIFGPVDFIAKCVKTKLCAKQSVAPLNDYIATFFNFPSLRFKPPALAGQL